MWTLLQDNFHSDDPIGQKFRELGNRAEGVIVAYLMGHDPDPKAFMANAVSLIEGGADILEIGISFSDPIAYGPDIQVPGTRALSAESTPGNFIDTIGVILSQ